MQRSLKNHEAGGAGEDRDIEVVQLRRMLEQLNSQVQAKDSEIQQLRRLPSSTSVKVMQTSLFNKSDMQSN